MPTIASGSVSLLVPVDHLVGACIGVLKTYLEQIVTEVFIDPDTQDDAMLEKYRLEREKRLRADTTDQYVKLVDEYTELVDDPFADLSFTRAAIKEEIDVLIVGGGMTGLIAGSQVQQLSLGSFRIVERGGDFGGTWYWNRYPGAACDTESYVYLPLLEETGYIPKQKYAKAPEIYDHLKRIGEHFDLYDAAIFHTSVTEARWDDNKSRWLVKTDRQDEISAKYLVIAVSVLQNPKFPRIAGLNKFRGHKFHTARWDYEYTGGDSTGGLTGLQDKTVGIIGTGATAVQCIPHLGEWSRELFVFQRTPSSVDVRDNCLTDPEWVKSLKPGWQKERLENFSAVISGEEFEVDLVQDGWTRIIGNILLGAHRKRASGEVVPDREALMREADNETMRGVRARIDNIVKDRETAEALKPWYGMFCKRPCFHDEYLPTFNRPNVHLVDTDGQGVQEITKDGVVVLGKEYKLDCLVLSTGFEFDTSLTKRVGFELYGRNGTSLDEKWKDGTSTLHGMFTNGFPNCFTTFGPQSGQSANNHHILDIQAKHIARIIKNAETIGAKTIEPTVQAQDQWTQKVIAAARGRQSYLQNCTPSYYSYEASEFDERITRRDFYWKGPINYLRILENWREKDFLEDLDATF